MANEELQNITFISQKEEDDELNLKDLIKKILRYKWSVLSILTLVPLATFLISFWMPKIYISSTTIFPVNSGQNRSALLARVSSMAGISGGTSETPLTIFLESKTLAERVISKLNLTKAIFKEHWDENKNQWLIDSPPTAKDAVSRFKRDWLNFSQEHSTQLITINIESHDPKLSAEVATGLVNELQLFLTEEELTTAQRYRKFIQRRLVQAQEELFTIGKNLAHYYKKHQISSRNPHVNLYLSPNSLDIHQMSYKNSLQELNTSLENLENQKEEIEKQIQSVKVISNIPQDLYLNYLALKKEIQIKIVENLHQQLESAKMEEAREKYSFTIIDPATVPKGHSKPNTRFMVVISFILSILVSLGLVIIRDFVENFNKDT